MLRESLEAESGFGEKMADIHFQCGRTLWRKQENADSLHLSGVENEVDKSLHICGPGHIISSTAKWNEH